MKAMLLAALAALIVWPNAVSATEAKWVESEVTLDFHGAVLHGTYTTIGTWKTDPDAVLFLSGSGPTDRDCNQPGMHSDCIKLIAHALAEQGIASLRFDKRAIGASVQPGLKEDDLRFDTYIDDARQWLAFLKSQTGVHRIFVVGHSEGALIGAVVAQDAGVAGYVSLEGAGERASIVIRRQLKAGPSGDAVLALAEPTLQKLEAGELDPSPSPILAQFFRASIQPYLISWFKYDPAAEIRKVPGKVLIVQGTHDIQVLPQDAELLHAARPDASYVVIPEMNHILRIAPVDRAANFATYNDPALPLAPGVMEAVSAFLTAP